MLTSLKAAAILAMLSVFLGEVSLAATSRPARFNDRCSTTSEIIGHPVPPYSDTAEGIINDYPIGALHNGSLMRIGDVYPTVGGTAYFVPTSEAFRLGLTSTSDASSIAVGRNKWLKKAILDARIVGKIQAITKKLIVPRFLLGASNHASSCFSRDWNGKVP